jgi:hypothetical protein
MTFETLFNAVENKTVENKTDLLIAERILEAERDWINPLNDLNEFILALETEIGGKTSKANLITLLERYQKDGFINSAWNTESVTILLEIFDFTKDNSLKTVFENLSKKISAEK